MSLNPEQLERAVRAFCAALPEGTLVKLMQLKPRVGFVDDDVGYVTAFVIADSSEDYLRFEQVVNAGMQHYQAVPGLTDKVWRQMDMAHESVNGKREYTGADTRKVIYLTDITEKESST